MKKKNQPLVSIVIVSFNTKDLLVSCLNSIKELGDVSHNIFVSDNGSIDGTVEALKKRKDVELVENSANLGFARANNVVRNRKIGKYVLFLNPDTLLQKSVLSETVNYLQENKDVGALTCKVVLPDGSFDKDTTRSFPTPFVALTHFLGFDRVFPRSKIFSKYWYGYLDHEKPQEIDSLQGAYFLARRNVLDKVEWFDEDYFLDGEDIDLCWKIKEAGYKIIYYPFVSIVHIKKGSKSKNKTVRSVTGGVEAMKIFYRKRLWSRYPIFVNILVIFGINILKFVRTIKCYLK